MQDPTLEQENLGFNNSDTNIDGQESLRHRSIAHFRPLFINSTNDPATDEQSNDLPDSGNDHIIHFKIC